VGVIGTTLYKTERPSSAMDDGLLLLMSYQFRRVLM